MHLRHHARGPAIGFALGLAAILALPAALHSQAAFLRGDSNRDALVDISDALSTLGYLFLGTNELECLDAADSNDDGGVDIADATFVLGYLFLGTAPPPAPGPNTAGPDPTPDDIGCGPEIAQDPYEPPEEPPASPVTSSEVQVRGWDPKQKKAIIGRAVEIEALRIPGRGLDFAWILTYRSRFGRPTPQGNGWDFSYNLRLEEDGGPGGALILRDGTGRGDVFERHADAVATRGFFVEGREDEAAGTFVFRFRDGGAWNFHWAGGPLHGRIQSIQDRNGNEIRFEYVFQNNQTDLEFLRVRDTLDREITAAFDSSGRVATLTDFTGREVRFEYYRDDEDGGSPGDLKRVITPPFTVGNDPPRVRTTTFTYTTGSPDERLNHNLLTMTGPRVERALTLSYSPSVNPSDPSFDRITSWIEGEGSARRGLAHLHYGDSLQPLRVTAVDIQGNVDESTYDGKNRLVRLRQFTGRSDPSSPVTDTENRPSGKLRPGDPDVFETTFEWNADSLLVRAVSPELSSIGYVHESDIDPTASPLRRGNLRELRRLPGPRGADQPAIVEAFDYDPGTNQVRRITDARGNEQRFEYDARGNLLRFIDRLPSSIHDYEYNAFGQMTVHLWPDNGSGQRRREEYEYHGSDAGPQNGYLKTARIRLIAIDSEVGLEYDARGNVLRSTDPRGHVWRYEYNELDEMVRVVSPPSGAGVSHEIVWDTFRDLGGNAVRVDTLNVDAKGQIAANTHLSTVYEYDALNRLARRHEESGSADLGPADLDGSTLPASEFITTEYEYDLAGNLTRIRPEGVPGEPVNVIALEHDERGFLFRRTRGSGSPDASTDEHAYDGNGNRVIIVAGLEGPAGAGMRMSYDGYDRLVLLEDGLGNQHVLARSVTGEVAIEYTLSDPDDDPAQVRVRLEETRYDYDAMDRVIRVHRALEPGKPGGDGTLEEYSWSDASLLVRALDPNRNETRYEYDAAGRLRQVTDALGNTTAYEYDASGNLARRIDTELGAGSDSFETTYSYDALGRRIDARDQSLNPLGYAYDSRSNLTEVVNAVGGVTRYEYDGAGRLTAVRRSPDAGPTPGGTEIIDRLRWDSSSRLVEVVDPNGNITRHRYDALDRRVSTTLADGGVQTTAYDLRDNPVTLTDPNGTRVTCTYDPLDRLIRRDIAPGAGVSGATTFEEFRWDGLSRLVSARNDASTATFVYDALSRVEQETLDSRITSYTYDLAGNLFAMSYPGGTSVRYVHDALNRVVSAGFATDCCGIVDSTDYAGPGRLLEQALGNGVASSWTHDATRRPTRALHQIGTPPTPVSDRSETWDSMYRRVGRGDLLPGGITQEFSFDATHRLIESLLTALGTPPRTTAYNLDPAGNRTEVTGAFDPGRYLLDPALPEPADFQGNQYTSTPFDQRAYDRNGNLLRFRRPLPGRADEVACSFDYADRLVEVEHLATGETVTFTYDALGRRSSSSAGGMTSPLSYHGRKVIEGGTRGAVYVYFGGHPRLVQSGGQDYFVLQDGSGNAVALTDAAGNLVETYEYGDFALPRIRDAQGNPSPGSKVGNVFLYGGLEYDGATGLYYSPSDGVHFDPRSGETVNAKYKLQPGFIYAPAPAARRNLLVGHDPRAMVSDFGLARRGGSKRDPDGLVFNLLNPRRSGIGVTPEDGLPGGAGEADFREVGGLDVYIDTVEIQEGGLNTGAHKRPGPTRFSHICLKRGVTKSKAFFNWIAGAVNRDVKRMGGKIALCKREGTPVIEWTFEKGWPCRYEGPRFDAESGGLGVKWEGPDFDASKNEVAIETLEIAHEGFQAQRLLKPLRGRAVVHGNAQLRKNTAGVKMSDNGWGSCFNCHPFGLERPAGGDRDFYDRLTSLKSSRHDHAMAAIQNTR